MKKHALLLLVLVFSSLQVDAASKPNIVFIFMDRQLVRESPSHELVEVEKYLGN